MIAAIFKLTLIFGLILAFLVVACFLGQLLGWLLPRAGAELPEDVLRDPEDPKRPASPHHPAYVRRDGTWFKAPPLQDAPAVFLGYQERYDGRPPIELWNLTAPIPGHPAQSTLSRETLEARGYWVPRPPARQPASLSPKET